jgi:hypothetical protein
MRNILPILKFLLKMSVNMEYKTSGFLKDQSILVSLNAHPQFKGKK